MDLSKIIEERSMAPEVQIDSANNGMVDLWSFRQKKNLVIYFCHDIEVCNESRILIDSVIGNYDRFRKNNCEVLWFSPTPIEQLAKLSQEMKVQFPLIVDERREVAAKFLGNSVEVAVYIVDRFGEVSKQYKAEQEDKLPQQETLLKYASYLELRCPECGI